MPCFATNPTLCDKMEELSNLTFTHILHEKYLGIKATHEVMAQIHDKIKNTTIHKSKNAENIKISLFVCHKYNMNNAAQLDELNKLEICEPIPEDNKLDEIIIPVYIEYEEKDGKGSIIKTPLFTIYHFHLHKNLMKNAPSVRIKQAWQMAQGHCQSKNKSAKIPH